MTDKSTFIEQQRLNKFLASSLGISRRQADLLIDNKKVKVNNSLARLGQKISAQDQISVGGKIITTQPAKQIIALNKPVGYTCSRRSQAGDRTIYQLLPKDFHQLKPVGRLDKNSSGLLLLTNDGDFIYKMTHPKFHKNKTYLVKLDKLLESLHQQMISDFGVDLADGKSQLTLSHLKNQSARWWQVEMHEGRNRQIRRTFASLDYEVIQLHRIALGNYQLGELASGAWQVTSFK